MFSVGGAGAQKEIGIQIIQSLRKELQKEQVRVILSAGIKESVREYFASHLKDLGLSNFQNNNIKILFKPTIEEYFTHFNLALRNTDVLWTKPSELSFYTGLGLPIIIAPTIGSQEDFNRKWLLSIGAGILQEDPSYTSQWLFDLLESGRFAEAAMQGFVEVEKLGALKIPKIIFPEP
jgi:UDP-N-acetylglucosamine:LPS N-acetylglucosamine transferase